MQIQEILATLRSARNSIQASGLKAADLKAVKETVAQITCELKVLEALAATRTWLWDSKDDKNSSKRSADHKSRLNKMIRKVHGTEISPDTRFATLSSLDIEAFLFVAASYTPLSVQKVDKSTFECISKLTPQYVANTPLPPGWLHREEFQIAVNGGAMKGSGFKRKYQDLEYTEAPKRLRLDTLEHATEGMHYQAGSSPSQHIGITSTQHNNVGTSLESAKGQETRSRGTNAAYDQRVRAGSAFEGIETAFEIPREVLDQILGDLDLGVSIMTIPTEDRVSSILHTVPREDAIKIGERHNLRRLPLSMSA